MYGDIISLKENMLLVEGKRPSHMLWDVDISNSVLYKSDNTLYMIDTGATSYYKEQLKRAILNLQPFDELILLNSHAHPDHTANNSIIHDIDAKKKKHFLSEKEIALLDPEQYFINQYSNISEYFYWLEGPRGILPKMVCIIMKLIRVFNVEYPNRLIKRSIKKLSPIEVSTKTIKPYESLHQEEISFNNVLWKGWKINDDIYVLKVEGHSPGGVVFYIPNSKVFIAQDETWNHAPCWPDSNLKKTLEFFDKTITMAENGDIEIFTDGHHHEFYRNEEILHFLTTLRDDILLLRKETLNILKNSRNGLTINRIYKRLRRKRNLLGIKRQFDCEYPKMPPFLKTVITSLLIQEGCKISGKTGKKRFSLVQNQKISIN